jgi:hypothetical protein
MSKYGNLDKFLEKKGKKVKEKTKVDKSKMTESERDKLIDQMLEDFGYIE